MLEIAWAVRRIDSIDNLKFKLPHWVDQSDYIACCVMGAASMIPCLTKTTGDRVYLITETCEEFDPLINYEFPVFFINSNELTN